MGISNISNTELLSVKLYILTFTKKEECFGLQREFMENETVQERISQKCCMGAAMYMDGYKYQ